MGELRGLFKADAALARLSGALNAASASQIGERACTILLLLRICGACDVCAVDRLRLLCG